MRLETLEPRLALSAAAMDLVGLTDLRADPFFSQFDGTGSTVVVIDQPIDWTSSQLASRRITDIDILGASGPLTGESHGTFVASIVAASTASIGVAPGAGLIGVTSDGSPPPGGTNPGESWRLDENDIEDLLQWVIDHREQYNIVAVNLSLGDGRFYTNPDQVAQRVLNDEIARLEDDGVVVIAAAGNDYPDDQTRNAAYPAIVSALAVGAVYAADVGPQVASGDNTTGPDRIAAFSQRAPAGTRNAFFAPGAAVRGVLSATQTGTGSGTSFAAPYVAGAVAILQQAARQIAGQNLSVETILDILSDSAVTIVDGDDEDDNVANTNASFDRLDIFAAVTELNNRYSAADIGLLGGSRLDQPIEHETKAKRANGTGFGPVLRDGATKDAVFFITNTGTEPLVISAVEVRGQQPQHWTITLLPQSTIAPGGTAAVVLQFNPDTYGTVRANLAIFSNDPDRARFTARIAGVGTPPDSAPDIAVTGDTADIRAGDKRARGGTGTRFGAVPVTTSAERIYTIRNTGGSALSLSPDLFFIAGAHPTDFLITSRPPVSVLQPGETTTFAVFFSPTAAGLRKADVLLISSDPDETPFAFRIIGTGA